MAVLTTVLMLIIIFANIVSDKQLHNEAMTNIKEKNDRLFEKKRIFESKHLNDDIEEYCFFGNDERHQKDFEETKEFIESSINGDAWYGMIYYMMMAEKGVIPRSAILLGIRTPVFHPRCKVSEKRIVREHYLKYLKLYNSVLREHGVDEDLYFISDLSYFSTSADKEYVNINDLQVIDLIGSFVWMSMAVGAASHSGRAIPY